MNNWNRSQNYTENLINCQTIKTEHKYNRHHSSLGSTSQRLDNSSCQIRKLMTKTTKKRTMMYCEGLYSIYAWNLSKHTQSNGKV